LYTQSYQKGVAIKPKTGYCINCDNRHGCKSKDPPCIVELAENCIIDRPGKQYLIEQKKTDKCKDCSFFRTCWNVEDYNRIDLS
jgi:hypothetical protein